MTLLVFLGILVSLLILRLVPGLLMQLALAIPRYRLIAMMGWVHGRKISIALPRMGVTALSDALVMGSAMGSAPAGGRLKLVLVSSSLLVLAVLATTAFWTWHSTALMMLLH
jgi:hypothetical protein